MLPDFLAFLPSFTLFYRVSRSVTEFRTPCVTLWNVLSGGFVSFLLGSSQLESRSIVIVTEFRATLPSFTDATE